MRVPKSTYRLQIREEFDLTAAAAVADYIHALGADWMYLSPILKAERGSAHGYDVIDHSMVDPARGGAEGLDAAAKAARELGLGAPRRHRAQPRRRGDAAWRASGGATCSPTVVRPATRRRSTSTGSSVAARSGSRCSATSPSRSCHVADGELRYHEHRFPLAPGSADDDASPADVHARQHYELINWRRADAELNYRRFFAVNTLAGIRVEVPWVFDESHVEIVRWIRDGIADGLRVDHPDGLADPGGYLDALAAATGGTYVLVEKILEGDEQLPASWAAAGTTGYDALADIDRVLVDPTWSARRSTRSTRSSTTAPDRCRGRS